MKVIKTSCAIILNDELNFLTARKRNSTYFIMIGGKIKNNESPLETLIRETKEEIAVDISTNHICFLGQHSTRAVNEKNTIVEATIFLTKISSTSITPHSEIEELKWLTLKNYKETKLANLLKEFSLPIWKALQTEKGDYLK